MAIDSKTTRQYKNIPARTLVLCKRNEQEWLKCQDFSLHYSTDGGVSWNKLPMNRSLWSRLVLAASEWPPIPRAIGWREGKIAIVHDDFHEDGSPNFRFVSTFDPQTRKWSTKSYGPVTDYSEQWWKNLSFENISPLRFQH